MRLGEGAGPDWHLLEPQEQAFERVAQLSLDERPRLRESDRFHSNGSQLQLVGHVWGQEVSARREEASQLGERGTEIFEGGAQPRADPPRLRPPGAGEKAAAEHEAEA